MTRLLGGSRLEAYCYDGKVRQGRICGRMRGRAFIRPGEIIRVSLRDFEDDKADVIGKYSIDDARKLVDLGESQSTDLDALRCACCGEHACRRVISRVWRHGCMTTTAPSRQCLSSQLSHHHGRISFGCLLLASCDYVGAGHIPASALLAAADDMGDGEGRAAAFDFIIGAAGDDDDDDDDDDGSDSENESEDGEGDDTAIDSRVARAGAPRATAKAVAASDAATKPAAASIRSTLAAKTPFTRRGRRGHVVATADGDSDGELDFSKI